MNNFKKEKTIFGVIDLIIFGLSIGLVAWVAKISPSLNDFITNDVIEVGEALLGINYGYQNLEICSFVFFGLLIIVSFIGTIMFFVSKEPSSKINIRNTTLGINIVLILLSIPLIVIGSLALEDNRTVNNFDEIVTGETKEVFDSLKKHVPYKELGIANLLGGCLIIVVSIFMLFWYFYKMRSKQVIVKEEVLPELEPVSLRPQNRNL